MTNDIELNPKGYTKLANAAKLFDVSVSTLRRKWADGNFPQPVKPFGYDNYFKNSDLIKHHQSINNEPA